MGSSHGCRRLASLVSSEPSAAAACAMRVYGQLNQSLLSNARQAHWAESSWIQCTLTSSLLAHWHTPRIQPHLIANDFLRQRNFSPTIETLLCPALDPAGPLPSCSAKADRGSRIAARAEPVEPESQHSHNNGREIEMIFLQLVATILFACSTGSLNWQQLSFGRVQSSARERATTVPSSPPDRPSFSRAPLVLADRHRLIVFNPDPQPSLSWKWATG